MNFDDPSFLGCASQQQIAALDEREQRQLLHSSDPRVRVWAAWALGLRLSADISPELRDSIGTEPVAGVRRHLVVMLAGFGEVDIVAALARHDPDQYVRKTAARLVAELAARHRDAFAVATQLLNDEDAWIRAAIIDGLPTEVPDRVRDQLRAAADDEDDIVREAVARRAAREADLQTLRRAAFEDRNSVVRRAALKALVAQVGLPASFDGVPAATRLTALADLRAAGVTLTYDEIAELDPGPAYLELVAPEGLGPAGRMWLLNFESHQVRDYWRRVTSVYADVTVVDPAERAAVTKFVDRIEDTLRLAQEPSDDDEGALMPWGEWEPWEAPRRRLLALLRDKLG